MCVCGGGGVGKGRGETLLYITLYSHTPKYLCNMMARDERHFKASRTVAGKVTRLWT